MASDGTTSIWKRKTFWAAMAVVLTSIGAFFAGEIELLPMIMAVIAAFGAVFMRQGIDKVGN